MTNAVFDAHASGYDAVASSLVGVAFRSRVHQTVRHLVGPTSRVLDLGCGTGIDSAWLGGMVESVHAVDPSAEMVVAARTRTAAQTNVEVTQGNVESAAPAGPFDLVLANFGAINCVPSLAVACSSIQASLAPGGHAVLVTMPRVSPLERVAAITSRNRDLWGRRVDGPTDVAGYSGMMLSYATAGDLAGHLQALESVSAESIGLFLPSFEHRDLVQHRPRLAKALAHLDRSAGGLGGRIGWGDHIIAVFAKPA